MAEEQSKTTAETMVKDLVPSDILKQAVMSGATVDVMERLLALQERWEASQARKAFDNAMASVREDLPQIVKTQSVNYQGTKGRVNYRYEDLSAVTEALTPVLAKHGLSFRWRTNSDSKDAVSVTCVVSHRDGHAEETTLSANHDHSGMKNDIQAIGSAVTYLQRYTLKAALGIAAANDDDGRTATPETNGVKFEKPREAPSNGMNSAQLGKAIMDYVNNDAQAAKDILQQICGKTTCVGMTPQEAARVYKQFETDYLNAAPEPGSEG